MKFRLFQTAAIKIKTTVALTAYRRGRPKHKWLPLFFVFTQGNPDAGMYQVYFDDTIKDRIFVEQF